MAFWNKQPNPEEKKPEPVQSEQQPVTPPLAENAAESAICLIESNILLNQKVSNKIAALTLIADQMLMSGYVSEDYTPALLAREAMANTYLTNGVAIPHGTVETKPLVVKTGLVVAQFPDGVVWNDRGEVVKLAVGIAASGNEHIRILQRLSNVVMDKALSVRLGEKAGAAEIAEALGQPIESEPKVVVEDHDTKATIKANVVVAEDFDIKDEAVVADKAGMHARPASLIAEMAAEFLEADIRMRNDNHIANAKSMAELLTMGAVEGDEIIVSAQGKDAQAAVDKLVAAIYAGLDAVDTNATDHTKYNPLESLPPLDRPKGRKVFKGAAASPGIATAPIYIFKEDEIRLKKEATDVNTELTLLDAALSKASEQLDTLYENMKKMAPNEAAIFKAQKQLLCDESILNTAKDIISEGSDAAWSWNHALEIQIAALKNVEDERIKTRTADLHDVALRVARILENKDEDLGFPRDKEFILLASELTPSQTAYLDNVPIRAICTELGGPNSHMAILARALGIPAIVGIGNGISEQINEGETGIVDPQSSSFVVSPDEATMTQATNRICAWNRMQEIENSQKFEEAITVDRHKINIVCNIAKAKDTPSVIENGGEGVGLLRTEFMFEASSEEPTVDDQVNFLKEILATLGSRQLVVRTADIGGDKPVSWLNIPEENNPFLGVRGIRLSFRNEKMFRHQLEAIYRVARWQEQRRIKSCLHIMFPMISKFSEWRKARDIAEQVRQQVGAPVLPLGIMVEVPAVAILANHFAKEVDFFSIGSNDLTQYTLAMDRLHPDLTTEADSYDPALLHLISSTVKAAKAHEKWVGVCGNMAADPDMASILVGLGVNELSVSPVNVPGLKMLIRSVSYEKLKIKAQKALELKTATEIRKLYESRADLI